MRSFALQSTAADESKFRRFADNVLTPSALPEERESLRKQLQEQIDWRALLFEKNRTPLVHGHARLDAQGYILNKVSAVSGAENDPFLSPSDAPVSYPFVWNTAQHNQIQWNEIAKNFLEFELFGDKTDFGALVRNTSEMIGVFAHIEADRRRAFKGYRSSLRLQNMMELERLLGKLKSPIWPTDVLPPLDADRIARGRVLFEGKADCARCHAHLGPHDLISPANDQMTPLAEVNTDVFTACNTYLHQSLAGNFEDQWELAYMGEVIQPENFTRKMLVNASVGTIVSQDIEHFRSGLQRYLQWRPRTLSGLRRKHDRIPAGRGRSGEEGGSEDLPQSDRRHPRLQGAPAERRLGNRSLFTQRIGSNPLRSPASGARRQYLGSDRIRSAPGRTPAGNLRRREQTVRPRRCRL